jgi:hypothetical protein
MNKFRTTWRWVIAWDKGLYVGQWLTRKDAIEAHVAHYYWPHEKYEVKDAWKKRRKLGDYAVKAMIKW